MESHRGQDSLRVPLFSSEGPNSVSGHHGAAACVAAGRRLCGPRHGSGVQTAGTARRPGWHSGRRLRVRPDGSLGRRDVTWKGLVTGADSS